MKASMIVGTILSAMTLLMTGDLALARGGGGAGGGGHGSHGAGSPAGHAAPHFGGGGSVHGGMAGGGHRVYSAMPPPYTGGARAPYSGILIGPGTNAPTNQPGPYHFHRPTTAGRHIPPQPGPGTQPNTPPANNWHHDNLTGRSHLGHEDATRLRNWHGKPDNFAAACRKHDDHHHQHHHRDWWHKHCPAIVWYDWGYWGWDSGWWYPAWGYDSYYSYYDYDGPIYGYDGLPPDQIIANVQGALQRLGYYTDAVDGVLGPVTQEALASYQRDRGLSATGAIDRQTLISLGFTS